MSVMVIDMGNSIIKAKIARRDRSEISFPHAIRQLSESEFEEILSRIQINGNSRVDETPYVIGESTVRHGLIHQRTHPVLRRPEAMPLIVSTMTFCSSST